MWGMANESGATDGKVVESAFFFFPPAFPPFESFRFVPLGGMPRIFKVPGMNVMSRWGWGTFFQYWCNNEWIRVAEKKSKWSNILSCEGPISPKMIL